MQNVQSKKINLPYSKESYFLALFANKNPFSSDLSNELQAIGYKKTADGVMMQKTSRDWTNLWEKTYSILQNNNFSEFVEVAINEDESAINENSERKTASEIQEIAQSLWLCDSLREDRLMCYFQPIVGGNSQKNFGYESFVRAHGSDDKIISGNVIVRACKALNIEYMVDRLLHVQAIKTFAASNNTGFLFINFFSGFIQRPEIYLEGLRENAKLFGIVPKNLVLELTSSEEAHDIKHLKSVCDYAKMQGYSVALDDVTSPVSAKKIIEEIRPDFIKLDIQAIGELENPSVQQNIRQILELVQATGGSVIAEGVETEKSYEQLKILGISLFQGYFFSAPAPVAK